MAMLIPELSQTRVCKDCGLDLPWIFSGRWQTAGRKTRTRIMVDERGRRWNSRKCPDCWTKDREQWADDNPSFREYQRQWVQDNLDSHREYQSVYYREHRETILVAAAQYKQRPAVKAQRRIDRAKYNGKVTATADGTINDDSLNWLRYEWQQDRCGYCFDRLDNSAELDHIVPVSKGGVHRIYNVVYACYDCNRGVNGKHDKELEEWLE